MRRVIEWSLRALLNEPRIEKVVVVVAADDVRWPALAAAGGENGILAGAASKLLSAVGGASRQESVLSGLRALRRRRPRRMTGCWCTMRRGPAWTAPMCAP